jgi:UDPglucose--hexose-1-phosphate uridylyltransferase
VASPEVRIDPLTGLKVVLAPARADRPFQFTPAGETHADAAASCPLCEGREELTPPEVWAERPGGGQPDTPGWLVRSVPNKFPLLAQTPPSGADPPDDPLGEGRGEPDYFASSPAAGLHEVIVHAPRHFASVSDVGTEHLRHAMNGWRERSAAHPEAAYVHVMVNEGGAAGASLEHSHAQLYALDFVPALIAREREHFTAHNTRTMGGCLLCDLLREEVRRRERVVAVDDDAVLLAPYASHAPYELRVVPRRHDPSFADAPETCAAMLDRALAALRDTLGAMPPYNLWVRTAPRGAEHFHWHIDVVPRLTRLAGFELGTGVGVNIRAPEQVAKELQASGGG